MEVVKVNLKDGNSFITKINGTREEITAYYVGKLWDVDPFKEDHKKEIETCGGFLKTLDYKEAWRLAWNKASKEEHLEMLKLPNWDNEVFKEISGIDAEAEIAKE